MKKQMIEIAIRMMLVGMILGDGVRRAVTE